jgi:hypothetical protein
VKKCSILLPSYVGYVQIALIFISWSIKMQVLKAKSHFGTRALVNPPYGSLWTTRLLCQSISLLYTWCTWTVSLVYMFKYILSRAVCQPWQHAAPCWPSQSTPFSIDLSYKCCSHLISLTLHNTPSSSAVCNLWEKWYLRCQGNVARSPSPSASTSWHWFQPGSAGHRPTYLLWEPLFTTLLILRQIN